MLQNCFEDPIVEQVICEYLANRICGQTFCVVEMLPNPF